MKQDGCLEAIGFIGIMTLRWLLVAALLHLLIVRSRISTIIIGA